VSGDEEKWVDKTGGREGGREGNILRTSSSRVWLLQASD